MIKYFFREKNKMIFYFLKLYFFWFMIILIKYILINEAGQSIRILIILFNKLFYLIFSWNESSFLNIEC
jgi:hypothetical protein